MLSENEQYRIIHGDVIPQMLTEMPEASVDCIITSPPFPAMFAYNASEADLGNSEDGAEMKLHMSFLFKGIRRVLKPGRAALIHCMQLPLLKRSGKDGLFDFRGTLIRCGLRAGLTYDFDWLIRKNPQSQAIRNKSWALKFQGIETDRAMCRGAIGDFVLKFRTPGENVVPVFGQGQVSRNDWIDWAEGAWSDIVETDTLNAAEGREESDTRHICPLQLGLIERLVRLYTNPNEIVLDPFMGIGSTAYVCLGGTSPKTKRRLADPRRVVGCELKDSYHAAALANCERAIRQHKESQRTLFDGLGEPAPDKPAPEPVLAAAVVAPAPPRPPRKRTTTTKKPPPPTAEQANVFAAMCQANAPAVEARMKEADRLDAEAGVACPRCGEACRHGSHQDVWICDACDLVADREAQEKGVTT